jgi:hypothetical protein
MQAVSWRTADDGRVNTTVSFLDLLSDDLVAMISCICNIDVYLRCWNRDDVSS